MKSKIWMSLKEDLVRIEDFFLFSPSTWRWAYNFCTSSFDKWFRKINPRDNETKKPGEKKYDTATFIQSATVKKGLERVTLGNFLIKRVVYEIQEELPNIKNFGTLSPIIGFRNWFSYLEDVKIKNIIGENNLDKIKFLKSSNLRIGDNRIIANKEAILKLVAHYLMNEKNIKGRPINDVCRFHLGNGAIIDDIVINANVSEVGFSRSFGVMVNYLYELKNIEKNHEEYVNTKKIIISDKLKKKL